MRDAPIPADWTTCVAGSARRGGQGGTVRATDKPACQAPAWKGLLQGSGGRSHLAAVGAARPPEDGAQRGTRCVGAAVRGCRGLARKRWPGG